MPISCALADTITPLLASDFVYLFILNFVIGILEGKALQRWFGGSSRAAWWMILANYASAWAGFVVLAWIVHPRIDAFLGPRPVERVNLLAGLVLAISFVVTMIVEFGFVHHACKMSERSLRRSILATISVNAASYLPICLWFLWTSYSLPWNAHVRSLADLGSLPRGMLYWVDSAGHVMARDLADAGPAHQMAQVLMTKSRSAYQLHPELSEDGKQVDLHVSYQGDSATQSADPRPLILAHVGSVGSFPNDYWTQNRILRKSTFDLRSTDNRTMQVHFDWYRYYLNTAVYNGPKSHLCVALATFEWRPEEPTILADDKILFEWSGQIVLFDPHTRKLAFIALGTCPCFVPTRR